MGNVSRSYSSLCNEAPFTGAGKSRGVAGARGPPYGGRVTTRHPLCAVGAIVLAKGEILLVRRDREPSKGQWSLPGGRVEWGESLTEACAREVREETAVEIEVEGLAGIAERIIPSDDGRVEFHYVILDYWAAPRTRDITPADDVSEARWVGVEELGEMALTPGLFEFLKDRGALEGRIPRFPR